MIFASSTLHSLELNLKRKEAEDFLAGGFLILLM